MTKPEARMTNDEWQDDEWQDDLIHFVIRDSGFVIRH